MSKKAGIFIIFGLIWLFLFSIPVGQGKVVFDVASYYIVSSRPVYWLLGQIDETVANTEAGSLRKSSQNWVDSSREKLTQSDKLYDYTE